MAQSSTVTAWDALLRSRVLLVGSWLRRQTAAWLASRARAGDVIACAVLARALDTSEDTAVRTMARDALLNGRSVFCLDAAWQVWADSRGTLLGEILALKKRPASTPDALRALSLLHLQDHAALQAAPPGLIQGMLNACTDRDPLISSRARYAIANLQASEAISILCTFWVKSRSALLENTLAQAAYQPDFPIETHLLVALKFNRMDRVTHSGAEIVRPLLVACDDFDREIRERAFFCLTNLQNPAAVNELCAIWVRERSTRAAEALVHARYVAQRPVQNRILSALKADRLDIAQKVSPEAVEYLLTAIQDADADVAARANMAMRNLSIVETRELLCNLVIDSDHPLARQIALDAGYLPQQPERRALFFFLTAQWPAYETLDYDQRLLNTVYETAPVALRQRIMRIIQQSGRTEFLTILSGSDHRSRTAQLSPIEATLMVRLLAGNSEWQKLWLLIKELNLAACKEALTALASSGFQPEHPDEFATFTRLTTLAAAPLALAADELSTSLPPAVPRSVLKLNGRVNDVAFAPGASTRLAIGVGSGRVVLWDYQAARVDAILRNFDHSVGQVGYTSDGILLVAERSQQQINCGVYAFPDGYPARFGQHAASVTALEPLPDGRILTTGRDSKVILWDFAAQRALHTRTVEGWARSACTTPDAKTVVLLKHSLEALRLDDLQPAPVSTRRTTTSGVYRSASILNNNLDLLAGMFNGNLYAMGLGKGSPPPRLVAQQRGAMVGVETLPDHNLVLAASAGADLRVYSLPELRPYATPPVPSERLTSLKISPDGAFMATGSGDSSMILWDLRLLDLPVLFSTPLAAMRPGTLATINALLEISAIPTAPRNALLLLQALLQYRFAFDIQIAEPALVGIQGGEFDVLID